MAYGDAGRVLAAIRLLAVQTRGLLASLAQLDPEQSHRRQRFTVPRAVFIAANPAQDPYCQDRQAGAARARLIPAAGLT